jgi:hypothetical protein
MKISLYSLPFFDGIFPIDFPSLEGRGKGRVNYDTLVR